MFRSNIIMKRQKKKKTTKLSYTLKHIHTHRARDFDSCLPEYSLLTADKMTKTENKRKMKIKMRNNFGARHLYLSVNYTLIASIKAF